MTQLNYSDFYQVPNLQFDIKKLREDLEKVLKKKRLFFSQRCVSFWAIPLNQIPNDKDQLRSQRKRGVLDYSR